MTKKVLPAPGPGVGAVPVSVITIVLQIIQNNLGLYITHISHQTLQPNVYKIKY